MNEINLFIPLIISCVSGEKLVRDESLDYKRYELAHDVLTKKENTVQPFLEEYGSDASGVKIIPKIFKMNKYTLYRSDYFKVENSHQSKEILKLSKKYTKRNWRKDRNYRVLRPEELKRFHGRLEYLYFSEIKNDSLCVDILGNPFAEYSMTTGKHFLIVFKGDSIKSIQKTISHYD